MRRLSRRISGLLLLDKRALEHARREEFFHPCFQALRFNGIDGDYVEFGCHGARTFAMADHASREHNLECGTVLRLLAPRLKHGMVTATDDDYTGSAKQPAGECRALQDAFSEQSRWRQLVPFLPIGGHGQPLIVEDRELWDPAAR